MLSFKSEQNKIDGKLEAISLSLIEGLNKIHKESIPNDAEKIVIWIPLGERYNLNFTFMTNDGNEIGDVPDHLRTMDSVLESILDDYLDRDEINLISKIADKSVAKWLKYGLESSNFKNINLQKVMAINNVCAYFDLNSLELLSDNDMWE